MNTKELELKINELQQRKDCQMQAQMNSLSEQCPQQETMMLITMNILNNNINQLQDRLQTLGLRLEPILDMTKISPPTADSIKTPTKPKLIADIETASCSIEQLNIIVEEIIDKIVL